MKDNLSQNDLACMREVISRRFNHYVNKDTDDEGFLRLPDLILVDGGKGQVSVAREVVSEMGLDVPVFGMVKDNKHRTKAIATDGKEISVSDMKPAFFLLTRIQDEVHRFAITYQRSTRKKGLDSELMQVKGIGEKKALKLLKAYKTKKAMKEASAEDIASTAGVSLATAEELLAMLNG